MSDTFKLIVPEKVEEKIRYLCRKYPTLEWSGVLFTTHKGTFEDKDLVITCEDLYPMDLGTSTYTDFKMSEDVASYMAENIELFDCDLQLIHSHNQMSCFFSGTDVKTLQEEGAERNCFVSLIVNNAGTYCAAITRKIQTKSEVIVKSLGSSYAFFGDGDIQTESDNTETSQIVDSEVIQYFMLDVEREEVTNHLSYLDDRFEEIVSKKKETKTTTIWPYSGYSKVQSDLKKDEEEDQDKEFYSWIHQERNKDNPTVKEPTLFDEETMKELEVVTKYIPDPTVIHEAVVKMVLCSLAFSTADKFDLKQWVTRHLDNVYNKIFGSVGQHFNEWCEFIVEYTISWLDDPNIPDELDMDDYYNIVAMAMIEELHPYSDNPYIAHYINTLERYIN